MRSIVLLLVSFVGALALPACTSTPDDPSAVYAECPCCRCNADLACVKVKVEPETPRATVDGVTYFFCSDECRTDFLANPQKYTRH